jgi:SOS-response transcriptional repressor LexA
MYILKHYLRSHWKETKNQKASEVNKMTELSLRQHKVLEFLKSRVTLPPTRAEISVHFGWKSANAAEDHLKALAKKGAIELIPGVSRGIRILSTGPANHCATCTCVQHNG